MMPNSSVRRTAGHVALLLCVYRNALTAFLCLGSAAAAAQTPGPPVGRDVQAARTNRPPVIDGRINDESWTVAEPASDFTQRDPDEGKAPSERTEIRFLYDDAALYVAARMFDREPGRIARRLSTRDNGADADVLSVYLDPMRDRLTGAIFRVSAANVQQDQILYNDTWTDSSWDAVWESAVSIDESGWSAELRIPLSQLRFPGGDAQTWGVNVERHIRRKNENAWLAMVPKNQNALASRMLNLTGLNGLKPSRRLELLPYAAGRGEFVAPRRAGNPFNDGSRSFASAGLDMKWGLSSNLTINATVNPDFGQVEVDPAVVNLTAFETFFQEKRPFFLEGSQIFNNFGRGGSNDFWGFNNSEPQIFYSRRIGRTPQLGASGEYTDSPTATTILGAAKLTGKTMGGWSMGFLDAVTGEETAQIRNGLASSESVVEPLSNYSVVRVQRDIGRRAGIGLLTTAVNRQLATDGLRDGLPSGAYVYGTDAYLFLDSKRDWVVTGNLAGSTVMGTPTVISRLQRSPQRYYQRPDAPHVTFDPTRSSLSGFTGRINLNRNQGLWKINSALWTGSPGFESNDLGFHSTGDRAGAHTVFQFRSVTPTRLSRQWSAWVAKWWNWNYARELQGDGVNTQGYWQFLNYWNVNGNTGWRRRVLDDRLTRGGPSTAAPGGGFWNVNVNSDSRKRALFGWNANYSWSDAGGWSQSSSASVTIKPATSVIINVGPSWNQSHVIAQYVRSVTDANATDTYGGRYVFGTLNQTQVSMQTRVSVILTPKISIQLYAQPLLAAGAYVGFKELARPRTYDFTPYGTAGSVLSYDPAARIYSVDPDGTAGAAPDFTFGNPDFNLKSLRVNAVFRWEMKPGSTFYGVWTRQQQDVGNPGVFAPGRDARAMFGAPGDDVILFKMAYWIGR
jgi:hypothetical protein